MNVIFYVMDCLRADHCGIFGYERDTTPVLDKLAAEGVAFSRCMAQSGWTAPSAATMFSSQHPSRTGIHKMRDALNPDMPWLPELLQASGYKTAGFSSMYQVSKLRGFERGFDEFYDLFMDEQTMQRCRDRGQASRGDHYCLPLSEDLHLRALKWLDDREDDYDPFFMMIWSIDTHEPFRHPAEYNRDADPDYSGPVDGRGRPFSRVRNRRDLRHLIDLYDGSLRYQDEKLGELIGELAKRDLLDETLIVVVGDHGEMFFEHGIAGHGKFPWEEELHVPLLMRFPQALPQAKMIDALVQMIDVPATILDLAGLEAEERFRGKSLRPLLEGKINSLHEAIILEIPFPFSREELARVVRTPGWKYVEYQPPRFGRRVKKLFKEWGRFLSLIVRPGMAPILYGHHFRKGLVGLLKAAWLDPLLFLAGIPTRRLFDLNRDPGELQNRLSTEPAKAAELREFLAALDKLEESPIGAKSVETAEEQEAKIEAHLKQLGYVEE